MTMRPLRALREINASISELERVDVRAREQARIELARSATVYSQKAREVLNGTMSLSAVLMRAGETGEAERLLAEVERDVHEEKKVLLESVQEVNVATRRRRERMTRLRLAKMVATAFLSVSVFAFSAMGIVAAKYFADLLPPATPDASASTEKQDLSFGIPSERRISLALGNMRLQLSPEEYEEFRRLVSSADPEKLRSFLLGILPSGLAGKVDQALAQAGITPPVKLAAVEATANEVVKGTRKVTASGGSAPSSSEGGGSEESSRDGQKRDDGSDAEEPSGGPSRCEDEDGDEERSNLGTGPLGGCIPLLDRNVSGS